MPTDHPTEEFRTIKDAPGYEASNWGRIRSWLSNDHRSGARISDQPRILKAHPAGGGYPGVVLRIDGKSYTTPVHRLVLETFVGPCPPGMEARHLDGDRTNAALWNLQWGTRAENIADKHRHGTQPNGKKIWTNKLTAAQVIEMRKMHEEGWNYARLGRFFEVSDIQARNICVRKHWTHLP